jgi:HSP20 family protein
MSQADKKLDQYEITKLTLGKIPVIYDSNLDFFWKPVLDFQKEFSNFFQSFYGKLNFPPVEFQNQRINPAADIIEDDGSFRVEIEMPGVGENDIKVSIMNNILTIMAFKEISKSDEGKDYIMREISYGYYEKNIRLPDNTDISNAESTFKKGMLWVSIPKKQLGQSTIHELEVKKVL